MRAAGTTLVVAALLLGALGTVSAEGAAGVLTVRRATWEGPGSLAAAPALVHAQRNLADPVEARIEAEAASAVVNWTRLESAGAGPGSSDPNSSFAVVAKGPATWGEAHFANARLDVASWSASANWMLVPGADVRLTATAPTGTVRPTANEAWKTGRQAQGANPAAQPLLSVNQTVAAGLPLVEALTTGSVSVQGNFTLYLWGLNATVQDVGGRRETYSSGAWSDNATLTAVDPRGVTRDEHEQFLRVRLLDAALRISDIHGPLAIAATLVEVAGSLHARLEEATGDLRLGDGRTALLRQSLELRGAMGLAWSTSSEPDRVQVDFEGQRLEEVRVDGAPWPLANVERQSLPSRTALGLVLASVGAGAAVAVWMWRRRGRDELEMAEADVLRQRPLRARRRLERFLAREPDNPHAWFLYGGTWIQTAQPDRAVEVLEPVAQRLPTPSIAFVLALAHAGLGRAQPSLDWLAKAVTEPEFRKRAPVEHVFRFLHEDPRFRRLVGEETDAYG